MIKIESHEIDEESMRFGLEFRQDMLIDFLVVVRSGPLTLRKIQDNSFIITCLLSRLEPHSTEICRHLRLGAEAAAGLFALSSIDTGSLDLHLGNEILHLLAVGPNDFADASRWCEGFFLAAVCRDVRSLDMLCSAPVTVLRASSTKTDEFYYVYVAALQAFWKAEPEAPNLLLQALRLAKPGNATVASADFLLFVAMSQMELLYHVLTRDEQAFNSSLIKSLEYHKRYWTSDEELSEEFAGLLALGLIAIASFSHEQGMQIAEIDSGYFPMSIVKGACAV